MIDTITGVEHTWSTSDVEGWQALGAGNTLSVVSAQLRSSGSGVLGMYKVASLEHADYIIVKARMRRNTATGTTYGRLRLVDTTTGAVIWKDSIVITTTNIDYSSSIGLIPAGIYRLECERRNSTATQIFLDNVLLAYVDTSTVVDCEGGRKDYRYGFNGQEKVDEISGSGNSYTAEYWQYDPRLGRRWNLDPKPQTYISDYTCFADNPILYNDIKGDKFDKASEKRAQKLEKNLDKKITELKTAIAELEKTKEFTEQQQKEWSDLGARVNNLQNARTEIQALRASDQMYSFVADRGKNSGETNFNPFKNVINIHYDGSDGILLHELKHAYQFHEGKFDFVGNGPNDTEWAGGNLYDAADEVEAYKRQYSFTKDLGGINHYGDIKVAWVLSFQEYSSKPNFSRTQLDLRTTVGQLYESTGLKLLNSEALFKEYYNTAIETIYKMVNTGGDLVYKIR